MLVCNKCKKEGHSLGYAERLYRKSHNGQDHPCMGLCYVAFEWEQLWIARNADSSLYLFDSLDKPHLENGNFFVEEGEGMMKLNPYSFPSVTHTNSPQKIDLCWLDKMLEDK